MKTLRLSMMLALALAACGPSGDAGGDAGGDAADTDGDGISDVDEGRADAVDTDGDGTPDYLDDDSDGDGIPDAVEAGGGAAPVDSDRDGTPDFRDLDSDDNGLADGEGTETTDDLDGDGIGNYADLDDDGDSLTDVFEIGGAAEPPDSDGDGLVDMHDLDSDADTILDAHELAIDPDDDGIPAYLDDDSDDDCRADAIEAGDSDLDTFPVDGDGDGTPDFLDIDSDNDGLADATEDADCDGEQNGDESSATSADSDGDGVSDLVETSAGTNPNDAADNPQANGDFVFVVPYEEPPSPAEDDLDFSTSIQTVDVYVLMDLSGSMSGELASMRDNMQTVLENLTCPPVGSGDPTTCIPDLWSGVGSFTYEGRDPYVNRLRLQPDPTMFSGAVPGVDSGSCPTGGCDESHLLAAWAAVTGLDSASSGCNPPASFPAAPSCDDAPAGAGGIGYPCFRPSALPVVLIATDEAPTNTSTCPSFVDTIAAAVGIGAKLVGILGDAASGELAQARLDLEELATGTGAVDDTSTPLVFDGADANAAAAIEDAIRTVANNVPIDVSATAVDDTGDTVDTVTSFVDHLETLQIGNAACTDGLNDADTDADGFADLYVDLLPGTPVCWRLVAKSNTTVPPTAEPQLFRATVEVFGDGVTLLDTREVFFLVPPDLSGPGID